VLGHGAILAHAAAGARAAAAAEWRPRGRSGTSGRRRVYS
jgi:hypothetical protein